MRTPTINTFKNDWVRMLVFAYSCSQLTTASYPQTRRTGPCNLHDHGKLFLSKTRWIPGGLELFGIYNRLCSFYTYEPTPRYPPMIKSLVFQGLGEFLTVRGWGEAVDIRGCWNILSSEQDNLKTFQDYFVKNPIVSTAPLNIGKKTEYK